MTTQRLVGIDRLFFMSLGLVGLGTLYAVLPRGTFDVGNFFGFFTVQANLLAAFTLLVTGDAALRSDGQGRF